MWRGENSITLPPITTSDSTTHLWQQQQYMKAALGSEQLPASSTDNSQPQKLSRAGPGVGPRAAWQGAAPRLLCQHSWTSSLFLCSLHLEPHPASATAAAGHQATPESTAMAAEPIIATPQPRLLGPELLRCILYFSR